MFLVFYLVSLAYCVWRMTRSYMKSHGNNVIGSSPGLETLAIIALAPVMMVVDVSLIWIRIYKESEEARRRNSSL